MGNQASYGDFRSTFDQDDDLFNDSGYSANNSFESSTDQNLKSNLITNDEEEDVNYKRTNIEIEINNIKEPIEMKRLPYTPSKPKQIVNNNRQKQTAQWHNTFAEPTNIPDNHFNDSRDNFSRHSQSFAGRELKTNTFKFETKRLNSILSIENEDDETMDEESEKENIYCEDCNCNCDCDLLTNNKNNNNNIYDDPFKSNGISDQSVSFNYNLGFLLFSYDKVNYFLFANHF
jgi:hypothetical protein